MKKAVERTIENLKLNGFDVKYFETGEEAKEAVLKDVPAEASAGFGGSVTVRDLGIYEALKDRGNTVYWHWMPSDGETRGDLLKKAAGADIYISGTNAITESGRLINIDGTGNRLSSLLFGHKKVLIFIGVNKIVRNYEEALIRIKNFASPPNAQRLKYDTPCATLGKCTSCDSPHRICNATLIIDRQPGAVPISIYIINNKLGY